MYSFVFRHFLSKLDPEIAHSLAFVLIRIFGLPILSRITRRATNGKSRIRASIMGLDFESRFGLAAGFDKKAKGLNGLWALGFGHVEVGTITALPQEGNPKPRLFRLIEDRALINRMGFNNPGAAKTAKRLEKFRKRNRKLVVGVNIGKSRIVPIEQAIDDYLESTRLLSPFADYLVVNVSSPNTPGLRGLQEASSLRPLLSAISKAANDVPVLVKIAPELDKSEIEAVSKTVFDLDLAGVVATNTTISRAGLASSPEQIHRAGEGGLSGFPLQTRSLEVLKILRGALGANRCIISVGGIETPADVVSRLSSGADLVQGYTAFIYRGPLWAREINRGVGPNLEIDRA